MMRVALCSLAAFALTGSALAAPAGTAKPTPAGTLKAEIAAFNAKDYAAAYAGYSAKYKQACPYAKFKAGQMRQQAQIPAGLTLSVRITGVRTTGSTATLSYQVLLAGQVVATIKAPRADKFVKVGGLWYDEVDTRTTC